MRGFRCWRWWNSGRRGRVATFWRSVAVEQFARAGEVVVLEPRCLPCLSAFSRLITPGL